MQPQNALNGLDGIAQLPHVAHTHRIALTPLYSLRNRLTADGDFDYVLNHLNFDAVAGDGIAVDVDFEVGLTDDPICEHGFGLN